VWPTKQFELTGLAVCQKGLVTLGLKPNGDLYVLYTVTFKKLCFTHTIRTV
jgi:hypothetical protein